MKLLKIIVLFSVMTFMSMAVHKYYLSLTQITYVEESQTLQITSEIFIDDLEKVLKKRYSEDIKLVEDATSEESKDYIARYINDKFTIKADDNEITPIFLGFEYKTDKIVCFLEAENVPKFSTFEVSNKVLFDMFSKQQNIVKLKVEDVEKSVLLIKDKQSDKIVL